jgi:fructokinase
MSSQNPETKGPTVACLGEILIDFISEKTGTLDSVESFRKCLGGAPANVAVGIARLGLSCGFIGKVGLDPFGEFLIHSLKLNGVDTGGISRTKNAPTALAFVSRSETGDREFLFYRNPCADTLLTEEDLPLNWLREIQFLHIGGVSLTAEPSRSATFRAVKLARESGATISFDPNLRLDLWTENLTQCRRIMHQLLAQSDLFLPSQEELMLLMGTEDLEEALRRAHDQGPKIICLKRGSEGSLISEQVAEKEYRRFIQPPFDVGVIDTTGAGDGFNAGLIVGLASGLSLPQAVKQGTAIASLVITKIGAITALPTEKELTHFLGKYMDKSD